MSWVRLPGAESCISGQHLARLVEQRLQGPTFLSAAEAELSIEGRVEPIEDGWQATLNLSDADGSALGTRQLTAREPVCRSLDDQVSLVIALMIDSRGAFVELPEELSVSSETHRAPEEALLDELRSEPPRRARPEEAPTPAIRTVQVDTNASTDDATRPQRETIDWEVIALLTPNLGLGVLPQPAAGLSLALALQPPRFWRIDIGGAYWVPNSESPQGGGTVDFFLAYGQLLVSPVSLDVWNGTLSLSAGLQLGEMAADGDFPDGAGRAARHLWFGAETVASWRVAVTRGFILAIDAAMMVPISRKQFTYDRLGDTRDLFIAGPVAGRFGLGLGWRF